MSIYAVNYIFDNYINYTLYPNSNEDIYEIQDKLRELDSQINNYNPIEVKCKTPVRYKPELERLLTNLGFTSIDEIQKDVFYTT